MLPALALLLLFQTSCAGPSFRKAWKAAAKAPASADDGVAGRWQGTWLSDANGHHGKLRCVVTAPESPDGPHRFFYHATWMRVLSGAYRADHQVKPDGRSGWTFTGEHQMPRWAGGLYQYEGTVQGDSFEAAYRCALDRGNYRLTRVPTAN